MANAPSAYGVTQRPRLVGTNCTTGSTRYIVFGRFSQKEIATTEEYTDFELYISHTYDFIQELFSKGATIEVLEPQSLRDVMRSEIKKMQKLYGL